MKLDETQVGGTLCVAPAGRLDTLSTPVLEAALQARISAEVKTVVLDLAAVDYVSSAALRVFLSSARRFGEAGGRLVFCGLTDNVRKVFAISGFESILEIHADRAAAIAAVG